MRPLLGPLLVLVGLGTAAVYGPMQVSRARATMSWPTTDGTVLDSQVVSSRVNRRNKWGPQVHYEYFIAGTRHESDSVWPGGSKSRTGRSFAEEIVARYAKGTRIKVYYDPDTPGNAVLEPGDTLRAWLTIGFGAVLMIVGAVVFMRRRRMPLR